MSLLAIALFVALAFNCAALLACFPTRGRRLMLFLLGIAAVTLLTMAYHVTLEPHFNIFRFLPRGIQYLPVLFLLSHSKASQMCFFTVSILTVTSLFTVYSGFLAGAVFPAGTPQAEWTALIINVGLLVLFLFAMIRWGRQLYQRLFVDVELKLWPVYSLYPIAALYVINHLYLLQVDVFPSPQEAGAAGVLVSILILVGFLMLYSAILSTYRHTALNLELELSQSIIDGGRQYYELLAQRIDELRILRHDYKHQLNIMEGLIQKGQLHEANAYLGQVEAALEGTMLPQYSTNRVVDALLGQTAIRCTAAGIQFEAQVELGLSEGRGNYELCTILGNLLENALEGCGTVLEGEGRYLRLTVKPQSHQLAIRVENSFDGVVRLADGQLKSRKQGGGTGLRSVKMIVDRLGGGVYPTWSDHVFTAYVLLNM